MPVLEDEFGDIIRKARQGMGLSVEQLARETGIDPEALSSMESYQRAPSRAESDALARRLGLGAGALWAIAEGQYEPSVPAWPGSVEIVTFTFPPINSHGYLARHKPSGATFLVDPGGDAGEILAALEAHGGSLSAVLVTHGHSDHVGAIDAVLRRTRAPVVAHPREWSGPGLRPVEGDAELSFGGCRVRVLHTPGHTEGGLTFLLDGAAFVGDTLFAGSLGGPLRGPGWYAKLLESGRRLVSLPGETVLLPGHGPATTAALERVNNPFLARGGA